MQHFDSKFLAGGLLLLGLQALLAWQQNMLTPGQMQASGTLKGLPFVAHGGMWGDICITFVVAYLVLHYGAQWSFYEWMVALALGTIMSGAMHGLYIMGSTPEAHVRDGHLTPAGWVHFVYMAIALTVLLLYYLWTSDHSRELMWYVTALLTIHVVIGNHFILGLIGPEWYPDNPLQSTAVWITILACTTLLVAVTYMKVGVWE